MSSVEIRPAGERFRTSSGWLESRHSFSFGSHFDPANTGFGLLIAHNDDTVAPAAGFDTHPHRDTEIVTWVLAGGLAHRDSAGNAGLIHPGLAQRMTAGTGIEHSERNDGAGPVRFVQMWLRPDTTGLNPAYEQRDVTDALAAGGLVPVVSGRPGDDAAIRINAAGAAMHVARLPAGTTTALPAAPYVHLFVALGSAILEGSGDLGVGDAARIRDADGRRVTAGPDGAELLVWELPAAAERQGR